MELAGIAQRPASPVPTVRLLGSKIEEATIACSGTFLHEPIQLPSCLPRYKPSRFSRACRRRQAKRWRSWARRSYAAEGGCLLPA